VIIVSDTSPISNLAIVGQLPLLEVIFQRVTIPATVYQDLVEGATQHVEISTALNLS
jgi:uncharacterized protein